MNLVSEARKFAQEKQTAREQHSLVTLKETLEALEQAEHDLSFTEDYIHSLAIAFALDNVKKAIGYVKTQIYLIEGE